MSPITEACNQQLVPVYDKPLVYYPLAALLMAGIRDILLISSAGEIRRFERLLGDGSRFGARIQYDIQPHPDGLAQAFVIGESFIGQDSVALVLGDNLFYGEELPETLRRAAGREGASIFAYEVQDPQRYGVIELDAAGRPIAVTEKPVTPRSNLAVPGIYFFDHRVVDFAHSLQPSQRGEYEITDLIARYLEVGALNVERLGRGIAWLDAGTPQALLQAANFVAAIEQRQGVRACCPEEVAARMGFITPHELHAQGIRLQKSDYGQYLLSIARQLTGQPPIYSHESPMAVVA